MYEKRRSGWLKHLDFMIVDMVCLQLAFLLSYNIRFGLHSPYQNRDYLSLAIIYLLIDFFIAIIFESYKNILKRGAGREFSASVRHVFLVEGLTLFYLFSTRSGDTYSRLFFYGMFPLYVTFTFLGRSFWKRRLRRGKKRGAFRSLLVIAPGEKLEECVENICKAGCGTYRFIGGVATDAPLRGLTVGGIPIVADFGETLEYVRREWMDEVFLSPDAFPGGQGNPAELAEELNRMGVVVHLAVAVAEDGHGRRRQIERLGNYTVLTTGLNCATSTQLLIKRLMDIAGGVAGCLITLAVLAVFGPAIYISSPGPVFFSQERVGRNGRKFRMYKFRTMYPDAEERRKEIQARNRVESGMMFKVDYDPRIIGTRKLSDGTVKEGIGGFLRRTSLDEFPQMFNILRGDMSLVGTRPPTVDEWERYEPHHRARLSFRPGLTGLWQVSGRSDITDFEEVVRLDRKYIDEWSIWLDLKILVKTVGVVFRGKGAM